MVATSKITGEVTPVAQPGGGQGKSQQRQSVRPTADKATDWGS